MALTLNVDFEGGERPPAGSPVRVEARDMSLADADPEVIGQASGEVVAGYGSRLAVLQIVPSGRPATSTLWAHVDCDRDGRVSKGDLITTESFPIPSQDDTELTVRVRLV
jgi:hypothetical protein